MSILIVNDGSKDKTVEIIKSFKGQIKVEPYRQCIEWWSWQGHSPGSDRSL
jgi:hypothetical protein